MIDFIKEISEENNDEEIFKHFKLSEELHRNFYNDDLDKEGLEVKKEYVDKLIEKLQKILGERVEVIKSEFIEDVPGEKINFLLD